MKTREAQAEERDRPRVLILGGGFGGIGAARKLRKADAEIVLVDRHDYHTFQPLLYQVATDLVDPERVGHPLRDLFHDQPNATVHQDEVEAIDLERREVSFARIDPISYDYLVPALGARVSYFGIEGAADHAFPMYTLTDAVRLKEHVLRRWEAADRNPSLVEDGALDIAVVGGGATGVESIGALSELYRGDFAKDYPGLPVEKAKLTLIEAGPSLLPSFVPELGEYAKAVLEEWGVDVMLGERVSSVEADRVRLESGRELETQTLVWGAGLEASPLAGALGIELGPGGRIPVREDLGVEAHPEVLAVGDVAVIAEGEDGAALPQLGSVALQAGEHAGENIARLLRGERTKPFAYTDKGTMAVIAPKAAVVQFPHGRTIKGRTAFLAWGAVHLALLSTGEDRIHAAIDWTWAAFTSERSARIDLGGPDR